MAWLWCVASDPACAGVGVCVPCVGQLEQLVWERTYTWTLGGVGREVSGEDMVVQGVRGVRAAGA